MFRVREATVDRKRRGSIRELGEHGVGATDFSLPHV